MVILSGSKRVLIQITILARRAASGKRQKMSGLTPLRIDSIEAGGTRASPGDGAAQGTVQGRAACARHTTKETDRGLAPKGRVSVELMGTRACLP